MSVLEYSLDDHIAVVTLNRPDSRNALSPELIIALCDTWDAILADDSVRVVVVTSSGGSTFCSGFDLGLSIPLMTGTRTPADEFDEALVADSGLFGKATLRDLDLQRPVIVAANGHAVAGGMEILLAA
ncbi:MAG: enoyl-CoA hydratase, partial [Candidatus Azotimanducaceae bacterium]